MQNKEIEIKDKIIYVLYFLTAIIYVVCLSYSTSFVFPRYWGSDSAIFQTIGMGWSKGALPYVDLFDHKGPIIFFIDMLGYKLTGTSTGVLVIQIISFFVFLLFLHLIYKENKLNSTKSFICTILVIMFLSFSYDEGNMTEEYILPYIAISFYILIKYLKEYDKGNIRHPLTYGFIYGICFAFGLMTRLTNSLPIVVIVVFITGLLMVSGQWENIMKNAMAFFLGCILIIMPFAIYFWFKGAFDELVWGTIGYNLFYTDKNTDLVIDLSVQSTRRYLFALAPIVGILAVGIKAILNKRYHYGCFYFVLALCEGILFLNISFYPHYTMIVVPNIALMLFEISFNSNSPKVIKNIYYCVIVLCCLLSANLAYKNIKWMYQSTHNREPEYVEYMDDNSISGSVMIYNTDNKCLYLDYGIIPKYRYFALQDRYGEFCDSVEQDIRELYEKGIVEWLIVKGKETIIDDILEEKYQKIKEYDERDIVVWGLKDK